MKLSLLILISAFGVSAHAIDGVAKSSAKLPFHKQIDLASEQQQSLREEMKQLYKHESALESREYREEGIVADFIDAEVLFGDKQNSVVDRRVNSVEANQLR